MHDWRNLSHVRWECKYHVALIPEYRRKVLYGRMRRRSGEILRAPCRQRRVESIEGHAPAGEIPMCRRVPPKCDVSHGGCGSVPLFNLPTSFNWLLKRPDNTLMMPTDVASVNRDVADAERAFALVGTDQLQQGAHLLGEIACRTHSDELRSQCLHGLAQVLEHVGEVSRAYELWYQLAHKPPAQRNRYDVSARTQVMRVFDALGLRVPPPDFPPRVQLEVTNRCNLRCIMCTRNQMRRPVGDLAFEHFRTVADQCSTEPGAVLLLYFLGEPLLHPRLDEMVAYLASVRHRADPPLKFGVQTNGMLLTRQRAAALVRAGLRNFHFSVDGLAGDLERIRPGARYDVVERNILDLLALRQEQGLDDLEVDITKLCDDREADEVKRFLARWEGVVDQVNLTEITRVAGNAYLDATGEIRTVPAATAAPRRVYCGAGQRLLVLASGEFGFCHGDVNGEIRLGHVEQYSIRQVWNAPEIQAVRERIVRADYDGLPPCAKCPQSRA